MHIAILYLWKYLGSSCEDTVSVPEYSKHCRSHPAQLLKHVDSLSQSCLVFRALTVSSVGVKMRISFCSESYSRWYPHGCVATNLCFLRNRPKFEHFFRVASRFTTTVAPTASAKGWNTLATCLARSRVGTTTRILPSLSTHFLKASSVGSTYAKVLPLPVLAIIWWSLSTGPPRMCRHAETWIGIGCEHRKRCKRSNSRGSTSYHDKGVLYIYTVGLCRSCPRAKVSGAVGCEHRYIHIATNSSVHH